MIKKLQTLFAREWFVDAVIISLLIIFTLIFFILIRKPPFMSDPLDYFFKARHPLELSPTHRHLRVGIIWPVWALQQVFGYSELSYYALPFLGLATLALGTYFLGKILFTKSIGIFAAMLAVINPAVLENGTRLFPDFLSSGVFTLAVAILLFLGVQNRLSTTKLSGRSTAWIMIAGLLIGWSYLVREYVAIFFPLIVIILLTNKVRLHGFFLLGFGALTCWVTELLWGWSIYGNPIIRLTIGSSPRSTSHFEADVTKIILQLPERFLSVGNSWIFVLLFSLGFGVCVWLWFQQSNNRKILSLWFIGGWLFFTLVALLPLFLFNGEVFLRMHRLRYWVILFPPMFVASSLGIRFLAAKLSSVKIVELIAFVLILLVVVFDATNTPDNFEFVLRGSNHYQEFREFIREKGANYRFVWLNQGSVITSDRTMPMYLLEWHGLSSVWEGEIKFYNVDRFTYSSISNLAIGGLLVLDRSFINALIRDHNLPDYILNLDLLGEPAFESTNGLVIAFNIPTVAITTGSK